MDKKNVQNRPMKTLLTEKKTPYDVEKLWSQIKREEKSCDDKIFIFFAEKYLGIFSTILYMIVNDSNLVPNRSEKFVCKCCQYFTCRKSQYERHLLTDKHKNRKIDSTLVANDSNLVPKSSKNYECECGKIYSYDSGYYRHKKKCNFIENEKVVQIQTQQHQITPELVMELIQNNKELQSIILEQNNTINNLVKNGTNQANHNTNSLNNNNNKTFNLQFFLNETCKDAMNIMDFVESIKLQLNDLEKVGEVGYTQGISNIITTNLKALDVTQRPVHCTDKKRETMYIKDEDKWEKEDDNKTKLRKVIKKVANKNIRLLPQFREKHPDYDDAESTLSDKYSKMVIEAMGGSGNNDLDKEDKIIQNISKCTTIEKYSEIN